MRRKRCRERHDFMVEQRHSRFDRVRHAHAVDLRQDVLRQVCVEIEAHHLAGPGERGKLFESIGQHALGRSPAIAVPSSADKSAPISSGWKNLIESR